MFFSILYLGLRSSNDESLWNFSTTAKPGGITPDTIDSNTTQLTPCAWILYSEIAGSRYDSLTNVTFTVCS